jgi:hypothetical protein
MDALQPLDILNPAASLIAEGEVDDLWSVFMRAVCDPGLLAAGGHWLWGVDQFEHDLHGLPFPWVLPVLSDERVWPRDFGSGSDPLKEDPNIRERWEEVVTDLQRAELATSSPYAVAPARAIAARQRRRDCRYFGLFDDLGFEMLVRIRALLTLKLAAPRSLVVFGVKPATENVETDLVNTEWFNRHTRIDFRRGAINTPYADDGLKWKTLFDDIKVTDWTGWRREYVRLRLAGRLAPSQMPDLSSNPRRSDASRERARERRRARRERMKAQPASTEGLDQLNRVARIISRFESAGGENADLVRDYRKGVHGKRNKLVAEMMKQPECSGMKESSLKRTLSAWKKTEE